VSEELPDSTWITVTASARLWGVTRQTAHKWFRQDRLAMMRRGPRGLEAPELAVRRAQVFSASDLIDKFKIPRETLATAERDGRVRSVDGRFSLEDLDVLRGRLVRSPPPPSAPPKRRLTAAERAALVEKVARGRGEACDFPDEFWDTEACPPFSPPAELFAFGLGELVPDANRPMARWITRSAGWERDEGGDLRWVEATDRYRLLAPAVDELPTELAESTRLYRVHYAAWSDEWLRRRPSDAGTTNK
jgi:hypothetical protein